MKYQLLPLSLLSPLSSIHLEYVKMALKLCCGVQQSQQEGQLSDAVGLRYNLQVCTSCKAPETHVVHAVILMSIQSWLWEEQV